MEKVYRYSNLELEATKNSCRFCVVKASCFPHGINGVNLNKLGAEVINRPLAYRGHHLFSRGDPEDGIYVIRAGTLKTYISSPDGKEQVTGFYLPGDVLGLDAFESGKHRCDAVALQSSNVCKIPNVLLQDICHATPDMFREMRRLIGTEILENQRIILTLNKRKATARLASFVLDWIRRCKLDCRDAEPVELPMSRTDIASYIGLTAESLSRAFSKLQQKGTISVSGHSVFITERNQLNQISNED